MVFVISLNIKSYIYLCDYKVRATISKTKINDNSLVRFDYPTFI